MPELTARPDDPALRWAGAIEVEHTPRWSRAWRLPHSRIDLFPDDMLRRRAATGAGVRISLTTNSTEVAGRLIPGDAPDELSPIDLVVDGTTVHTTTFHDTSFQFTRPQAGTRASSSGCPSSATSVSRSWFSMRTPLCWLRTPRPHRNSSPTAAPSHTAGPLPHPLFDNLHPDAEGYDLMAERITPAHLPSKTSGTPKFRLSLVGHYCTSGHGPIRQFSERSARGPGIKPGAHLRVRQQGDRAECVCP